MLHVESGWVQPYDVVRRGVWLFPTYLLTFEGNPINMVAFSNRPDAHRIAAAMNSAYNLGRMAAALNRHPPFGESCCDSNHT